MKNAINYYYNLYPVNLYQNEKMYKFSLNNKDYFLVSYNGDINDLSIIYKIQEILLSYNIYCHKIIENINKEIYTNINNKLYILLESLVINNETINLNNMQYYQIVTPQLHLENISFPKKWRDLWIEKVDYFEYQISNFRKKYSLINITSSYYIGLAENAIQLLYDITPPTEFCISHHRIKKDYTLFDMYNPLEFIIDFKVRDFSEYFKEKFFYENIELVDFIEYINNNIFDNSQAILFLSRILYPSYYFDICDDIIYNNQNENNLSKIISKADEYENILKKIYIYMSNKFIIPNIEWLKRS